MAMKKGLKEGESDQEVGEEKGSRQEERR